MTKTKIEGFWVTTNQEYYYNKGTYEEKFVTVYFLTIVAYFSSLFAKNN